MSLTYLCFDYPYLFFWAECIILNLSRSPKFAHEFEISNMLKIKSFRGIQKLIYFHQFVDLQILCELLKTQ